MRSPVCSAIALSILLAPSSNLAYAFDPTSAGRQLIAASTNTSSDRPADPIFADDDNRTPQAADGTPIPDRYPHIADLEKTILGQPYPGQDLRARLSRMEAKAFGKASTNPDMSQRTDALEDYAEEKLHKARVTPSEDVDVDTIPAANSQPDSQMKYPHINSLEKSILRQTYAGDSLKNRLSRLESKAFGVISSDPDLSHRTDALDQYLQQNLHQNSAAPQRYTQTVSETDSQQPGAVPMKYPHIDSLEMTILGQTYQSDPLKDRVSRMEVTAFGSASTNPDMSQRTDALENYAERKLHKRPQPQNNDEDTASNGGQQQGSSGSTENKILNMVGKALIGMSPLGMLGGGAMPFMSGAGMGQGPGRNRRQAARQQDEPTPKPAAPPQDPAVSAADPPPSTAKMITKVAWCEMQVFGHTSPDMHLTQRLEQLNQQLNYAPGQSGDKLMDDLAPLMKAVIAQKSTTRALGSASQPIPR